MFNFQFSYPFLCHSKQRPSANRIYLNFKCVISLKWCRQFSRIFDNVTSSVLHFHRKNIWHFTMNPTYETFLQQLFNGISNRSKYFPTKNDEVFYANAQSGIEVGKNGIIAHILDDGNEYAFTSAVPMAKRYLAIAHVTLMSISSVNEYQMMITFYIFIILASIRPELVLLATLCSTFFLCKINGQFSYRNAEKNFIKINKEINFHWLLSLFVFVGRFPFGKIQFHKKRLIKMEIFSLVAFFVKFN